MTKNKRGGRPSKSDTEIRKYRVNMKLNTAEMLRLHSRSKEAGVAPCDFIRSAIMAVEIRQRLSPEAMDIVRKLSGMANNLNQIAHRANAAGYRDARSEYLFLAARIDNLLNELER